MKAINSIGIISMQYQRPFTEADFPQFERWKKAGFDFVEFLMPEPGEMDLDALRRALDNAGMAALLTARVSLERNLASDEPACRQTGIEYLSACIDRCHTLGASLLGGPLYGSPLVFAGRPPHPIGEEIRKERLHHVIEALHRLGKQAQSAGIRLGIEPLNRYETDFLNTARQGTALIEAVGLASVGLILDTFHMNIEDDDIPDAIRHAGPHLFHFQANENHRGYLGSGHIDWTSVVRALSDIGFGGTITLEPFRRRDERIGIPFAQWKPPAGDEQAELTASCAFLRNLIALNGGRK